jgi:hypothetical protein
MSRGSNFRCNLEPSVDSAFGGELGQLKRKPNDFVLRWNVIHAFRAFPFCPAMQVVHHDRKSALFVARPGLAMIGDTHSSLPPFLIFSSLSRVLVSFSLPF